MDANQIYQSERAYINSLKEQFPEKFIAPKKQDGQLLEYLNAKDPRVSLPKAFLKYSPFDFIVEEIGQDNKVVRVDQVISSDITRDPATTGTVYADMIKIGIATVEAAYQLRDTLGCQDGQIQWGGIKDAGSLTAQKISFRGISADAIARVNLSNIILTHIREGKGAMTVGAINGNVFTIFLRTENMVNPDLIVQKMSDAQIYGVPNYYGIQRFGAPRFLSHVFGKYLCKGDPEGLLKSIFFETSDFEVPYVTDIRIKARTWWGNWQAIIELFEELPYTFRLELKFLKKLLTVSQDLAGYREALMIVPEQLDFWVKSYGSFYTNKILLDAHLAGNPLPEKIPLLASRHPDIMRYYGKYLRADGTERYQQNVRMFPCIKISPHAELESFVRPVWHGFKIIPGGIIMSFELGKGSYATTILNEMFEVLSDTIPDWVSRELVDTKQTLGTGSTQHLFEHFHSVLPKHLLQQ